MLDDLIEFHIHHIHGFPIVLGDGDDAVVDLELAAHVSGTTRHEADNLCIAVLGLQHRVHLAETTQQLRILLGNQKSDFGSGEIFAQRADGGQREHNVADGLEPDEQDIFHRPTNDG